MSGDAPSLWIDRGWHSLCIRMECRLARMFNSTNREIIAMRTTILLATAAIVVGVAPMRLAK